MTGYREGVEAAAEVAHAVVVERRPAWLRHENADEGLKVAHEIEKAILALPTPPAPPMTTPAEDAAREKAGQILDELAKDGLREPELDDRIAVALLATQEAARAEERAAVVAWLRGAMQNRLADAIQRGDHLTKKEAG